jgi:radical SAM protein with 4Fe4S-binding SPASM domain
MKQPYLRKCSLSKFPLWENIKNKRSLLSFDLEITARCNNNCRHCYINLPVNDIEAKKKELSFGQIKKIIDQAVGLGALWCLITGGEPLLRKDFFDIYLYLKKKGVLVSVFTNATLITAEHIEFFQKHPPRDIEVTVYGTTKETYEKVTRRQGSFMQFMQGLELLLKNNIKVRFKAMALRSNVRELPAIAKFCRMRTKDYFRFDPFLHLRFDRDPKRNDEIKAERLTAQEIVVIEQADTKRRQVLEKGCDKLIDERFYHNDCKHIFRCGAGNGGFNLSYDGFFRLCSSLFHPDCVYDLKKGNLSEAWDKFVLKVRDTRSNKRGFLEKCRNCPITHLCMWCPAHVYLETGKLDAPVEYFCQVAQARANFLLASLNKP